MTNDVVRAILARRSVREGYDRERSVDRKLLELIVACGQAAPSSKNARPWRLHVVTTRSLLDGLAGAMEGDDDVDAYVPHDPRTGRPHEHWPSTVLESAAVLRAVPAAVFIENRGVFSGGRQTLGGATSIALQGSLAGYAFECVGIGTAIENMWLCAVSLGLSAAFMGDAVIAEQRVRRELQMSGDLMGVLALGYSELPPWPAIPSPSETQVDDPVVFH